jgi:glutamate carboxypeptidase
MFNRNRNWQCTAYAAALAAAVPTPASAGLSRPEQVIVSTVESEQQQTVTILSQWVEQNSGTMDFDGIRRMGELAAQELQPLGFKVRWLDMSKAGRSGHLIAYHRGKGKKLLLIGHLDTVFEPSSPFQHWHANGDSATGPGVIDDKGGIAVILAALRAMKAAGTLRKADITIYLGGDEEEAGEPLELARGDLIREGKRADVAIDFEPLAAGQGEEKASTSRRGVQDWTLKVTARTGHSAGVFAPGVGYGAIYELSRILDSFRRELVQPSLTYNVGIAGGGSTANLSAGEVSAEETGKTNIIPRTAYARGDLRGLTQQQMDEAKARMQAIVAQSLPGTRAELTFDAVEYPPMPPTLGNRALLDALNQVNRDSGLPQMGDLDAADRGAGDISFVAPYVDGLAGMGAAGGGAHGVGESIDIPSIFRQAKRIAILLSRLSRERSRKR